VIFLASVILAIYLTGLILTSENIILAGLYRLFPSLQNAVANGESWVYVCLQSCCFWRPTVFCICWHSHCIGTP
jgi:hypothetical protein